MKNRFTMSRTGEMDIHWVPFLKSKRKFRLTMLRILCPKGVRADLITLILWLLLPGTALAAQSNVSETTPPNCPDAGSAQAQASCSKSDEGYRFKSLPRDVLHDQAFLWSRPFRPRRSDLPWAAAFFGTTAGLIAIDQRAGQSISANPPGPVTSSAKT
jgi:hypothetical protein